MRLKRSSRDRQMDAHNNFIFVYCRASLSPPPVGEAGDIATRNSVRTSVCNTFTVYMLTREILERSAPNFCGSLSGLLASMSLHVASVALEAAIRAHSCCIALKGNYKKVEIIPINTIIISCKLLIGS